MKEQAVIPNIRLNVDQILLKADNSSEVLTFQSSLSGLGFAINKQSLLMLQSNGFLGRSIDDWWVIYQELGYILKEAERWQRT